MLYQKLVQDRVLYVHFIHENPKSIKRTYFTNSRNALQLIQNEKNKERN